MTELSMDQNLELATQVACKQGMFPFPVNDTTIAIMRIAVGENEEELLFIGVGIETSDGMTAGYRKPE